MAWKIIVDTIPPGGGRVAVRHQFFGHTQEEASASYQAHAAGCKKLGPSIDDGLVDVTVREIDDDEWPIYDPN